VHRDQLLGVSDLELLGGFLDRSIGVGRLDFADPLGLGSRTVDVPSEKWFRSLCRAMRGLYRMARIRTFEQISS